MIRKLNTDLDLSKKRSKLTIRVTVMLKTVWTLAAPFAVVKRDRLNQYQWKGVSETLGQKRKCSIHAQHAVHKQSSGHSIMTLNHWRYLSPSLLIWANLLE